MVVDLSGRENIIILDVQEPEEWVFYPYCRGEYST